MPTRKKLTEIQAAFEQDQPLSTQPESETKPKEEVNDGSLSASLKLPKKSTRKIRFTLDLEKPLDNRLNKAANRLNRSKAELVRFAVERLLSELESEWTS